MFVRIIALGQKMARPGDQLIYIGLYREKSSCLKQEGLDLKFGI